MIAAQGAEAVVGINDLPGDPRCDFRASQGGVDDAYRNLFLVYIVVSSDYQSPSPSLAGQSVIFNQAVLLAQNHNLAAPSHTNPYSGIIAARLLLTAAGPRRSFTGLLY